MDNYKKVIPESYFDKLPEITIQKYHLRRKKAKLIKLFSSFGSVAAILTIVFLIFFNFENQEPLDTNIILSTTEAQFYKAQDEDLYVIEEYIFENYTENYLSTL